MCETQACGGERKKDNIDREEVFEEEYLSWSAIARIWQTEGRGSRDGVEEVGFRHLE